jgi:hypothetical protein
VDVGRCVLLVVAVACACSKSAPPSAQAAPAGSAAPVAKPVDAGWKCEQQPFAAETPVPEASDAGWLTIDGKLQLLVIGDSGNDGAYGLLDPETGATGEQGKVPLGGPGDDIEGVSVHADRIYGLTSAGWMRVWKRVDKGFELVDGPYAIGAVTLSKKKKDNEDELAGDGMVCEQKHVNCGRNYEGLCLAAHPTNDCVGFAAAKADGHLYCLVEKDGKLAVDHARAIAITRPGSLADCTFSEDDTLWAGSNMFDLAHVYRVTGWADPASAKVEMIGPMGVGFPEALAVRGDMFWRLSDTGSSPSLMSKFRCTPGRR